MLFQTDVGLERCFRCAVFVKAPCSRLALAWNGNRAGSLKRNHCKKVWNGVRGCCSRLTWVWNGVFGGSGTGFAEVEFRRVWNGLFPYGTLTGRLRDAYSTQLGTHTTQLAKADLNGNSVSTELEMN